MTESTDNITRAELLRALRATRRHLAERATGDEAFEALIAELTSPHRHEALYTLSDGGPCGGCGEWVPA